MHHHDLVLIPLLLAWGLSISNCLVNCRCLQHLKHHIVVRVGFPADYPNNILNVCQDSKRISNDGFIIECRVNTPRPRFAHAEYIYSLV